MFGSPGKAGARCTGCGGQSCAEDQAQRALEFSLVMAARQSSAIPFWNIAGIGDMYHRSFRGERSDATDQAVLGAVRLASEFADVLGRTLVGPLLAFAGLDLALLDDAAEDEPRVGGGPRGPRMDPVPNPYGSDLRAEGGEDSYPAVPGGSGGGAGGGGARCEVKRWAYPLYWVPVPGKGENVDPEDMFVGFHFEAEIEFKEEPESGIYCMCCVFRQFLKKTVTTGVGSDLESTGRTPRSGAWGRDTQSGEQYGGSRKDRSASDGKTANPPDSQAGEAAHRWSKCEIAFDDSPGEPVGALGAGVSELTYDFVGVVYDRCNQWAYVDSRRFILSRRVTVGWDESDPEEHKERVTDDHSRGARDVPPEPADSAWDHTRKGPDDKARPMPGTPMERA